jgi:hypothetical protein
MKGTQKGCTVAITVGMRAPYLSLRHLAEAMASAIVQTNPDPVEGASEQAVLSAAVSCEDRLRGLCETRAIQGHDGNTLAPEAWERLEIDRAVFHVDDLNASKDLAEDGFRFEVVEDERADQEMCAAFDESVLNERTIHWRYWVEQMPSLSASEAARLMAGLDPDVFADLKSRPNRNDPSDACAKVLYLERLALAEGRDRDTAANWLAWARERKFKLHIGFVLAVQDKGPAAEPASPKQVHSGHTPKQRRQESRILELLASLDHNPLDLPSRTPGKRGVKAQIRERALREPALFSAKAFDMAWERLRSDRRLVGGE